LAIDPKGVVGDPAFEVGAFLGNEWAGSPKPAALTARRLDIFASELGIDRRLLLAWGFVQSVLSAWWSVEDDGSCDESSLYRIGVMASLHAQRSSPRAHPRW
jgi:streptomycin 6-kinase